MLGGPSCRHLKKQLRKACHSTISGDSKPLIPPSAVLGQPTWITHSHILKENEVVPGFSVEEFVSRREKLVEHILSRKTTGDSHIIVVPSASTQYMTEKIPYVFRQNTDFRYLTGCMEPDSALVIVIQSPQKYESIMFMREKNSHSELWEGPRTGVDLAKHLFRTDASYPVSSLKESLVAFSQKHEKFKFWYDFTSSVNNRAVQKAIISFLSEKTPKEAENVKSAIHNLRVIKSKSERAVMKKSCEIASEAIQLTIEATRPQMTEHQLFATVDYHCRMRGAEYLAYPPVIAAGNNANIIHYIDNKQEIKDGDLILMDAGCELHGYCSDITRTWPANGRFSEAQRTLYDVVLSVQKDLIPKSTVNYTLDEIFRDMCSLLAKRLKEAHVLSKEAELLEMSELSFKLCPHHVSHYLGMDVHDTGSLARNVPLRDGMVVTIEPGVYLNKQCTLVKPEFCGIGIRIEDDILITDSGPKVLSVCPKDVRDIESIMSRRL